MIAIFLLVGFFNILCFISAFFRAYVVLHTYLDDRKIEIKKSVEKRIIRELNSQYPYRNSLTFKITVINDIEDQILSTIKRDYEKEINENIIKQK